MNVVPTVERPALSALLKSGTANSHRVAESSGFIQRFFRGQIERPEYGEYLRALRAVYAALEAGLLAHRDDPRLGGIVKPEVFRVAALDADLSFFGVPEAGPRPTTQEYVAHLEKLSAQSPHLLIAHAYTRTLGDLSGGQMLRKVVQQAFGLTGSDGVRFYEFPMPQLGAFKVEYRAALDALPLTADEQDQVVVEAVAAFELNGLLVRDL